MSIVDALRRQGNLACPACEQRAGYRTDITGARASVPWYRLAPVRVYCLNCNTQVVGYVKPTIWLPLLLWILVNGAAFGAFVFVRSENAASEVEMRLFLISWLVLASFSTQVMRRRYFEYRVAVPAP
ncbi:MAG: hypothetical protein M3N82_03470 [Pseudomonadota bacterium]|nr:hypothetical protein [Pseudomonadota bacterium]